MRSWSDRKCTTNWKQSGMRFDPGCTWGCVYLNCVCFHAVWKHVINSACVMNSAQRKRSWMLTIASLCCEQLLHFLQEFSQQTISRTHEIKKQVDGLISETKATDCRLHNVFNDFLMLSNTQFIENVSMLLYAIKLVLRTLVLSLTVMWRGDVTFCQI